MPDLGSAAAAAFAARRQPGLALSDQAPAIARACRDLADRFRRGGTLLAFGSGGPACDAAHVAVEFLHPAIVGKRALPALSLAADPVGLSGAALGAAGDDVFADSLRLRARPEDIALAVTAGPADAPVRQGLAAARELGLLTVALAAGDGADLAGDGTVDHLLLAGSADPRVVKEVHVTTYHVLWELVHVFLDEHRETA
jgi:D-sedoheptulose 7-phosphate isomerase